MRVILENQGNYLFTFYRLLVTKKTPYDTSYWATFESSEQEHISPHNHHRWGMATARVSNDTCYIHHLMASVTVANTDPFQF